MQHPILLASLVATLAVLLLTQLHRVPPDLRRPISLAVEVTILAALAVTGALAVITAVADTVKVRRATDRGEAMTMVTVTAMGPGVVAMDRATATATTAIRAMAVATLADRVPARAMVAATTGTTAAVPAMGTATTRTPATAAGTRTGTVRAPATEDRTTDRAAAMVAEAAVVKP